MSSTVISEIVGVLTTKTSSDLSYPDGYALSRLALEPLPFILEIIVCWSSVYDSATARKDRRAKLAFRLEFCSRNRKTRFCASIAPTTTLRRASIV